MKEKNTLMYGMALLFLVTFISFGTIILVEKKETIFMPKVKSKLNDYVKANYQSVSNLENTSIIYKDNKYTLKVKSIDNNNLYYNVYYKDKKITDSYKKDYVEGKTLLTYLEKGIDKKIEKETKSKVNVSIDIKLNDLPKKLQEKVINEENITSLKIYNLELNINCNKDNAYNKIISKINNLSKHEITPRTYSIILNINDKKLKINNLTLKKIEKEDFNIIINDIINDRNTEVLKENDITYSFLN